MNMKHMMERILLCGCAVIMVSLPVLSVSGETDPKNREDGAPQRESKWNEAGKGIKDAAGSVTAATKSATEATRETTKEAWKTLKNESSSAWEKTKNWSQDIYGTAEDKSKEAWQTTKEESKNVWEKGKSLIHGATAPDPPAAPPAAAPPPATAPPPPAQ